MKSIIITVFVLLIMLANLSGQWEIVRDTVYPRPGDRVAGSRVDRDVYFVNRDKGFIISSVPFRHMLRGQVSMTNDGGKTLNDVFTVSDAALRTCIFTSDSIGFVAGSKGLYTTTDSGAIWNVDSLTPGNFSDLFFLNEYFGVAVTDTSILETENDGRTWQMMMNCNTCDLNSIFFIDESTGCVVGEMGLIIKLSEGGTWETIASGTTLPLNKVFFADKYTGWIAGGYIKSIQWYRNLYYEFHSILLKTVNGGESWSKTENIDWLIHDLYFKNEQEGWAVGEDSVGKGIIIETIDGGNNWSVQVDSLRVPLAAIDFKDGYGWAVGSGLFLKYDPNYTGIKEDNEKYNSDIVLFQNYPNPFISKTVISYDLKATNEVGLSIYDLIGRKVATLVKEQQQAGRYEVEWNAEGMTPGIYFCELKAGQIRQVSKMIKIK
jgi:photosystem II stability/assembly factor-like uncharacterized protein